MVYVAGKILCQARGRFTSLPGAVGWTNYTHQPQVLAQPLSHSLAIYLPIWMVMAVVGLVRSLVGDGFSSIFVQDLTVVFALSLSAMKDW